MLRLPDQATLSFSVLDEEVDVWKIPYIDKIAICSCRRFLLAACRQSANWPKISIFTSQGRLVEPIHVKFGVAEGHVGPLGRAKFRANRFKGWERSPQKLKISIFFAKSCPAGANPLTDFYNF